MKKNVSQYGSWASPVSAKSIASGGLKLSEIRVDGDDIYNFWNYNFYLYIFHLWI